MASIVGATVASEERALDAYSRTVIAVAEDLGPSVANLQVRHRSRRGAAVGAGSGVVISGDGLLVTSAHVVKGAQRGTASFADGREIGLRLSAATPSPISPSCAPTTER